MVWAIAFSVIIFLFMTMCIIIKLGSFDDFEDLEYLTPSLLIAILGLFLLKPAFVCVQKIEEASNDDEGQKAENDDKFITAQRCEIND